MDVSIFTKFSSYTWNFWTCSSPAPKFPKFSENSSPTPETFGSAAQKHHQELIFPGKSRQFSTLMSLHAQNLLLLLKFFGPAAPKSPKFSLDLWGVAVWGAQILEFNNSFCFFPCRTWALCTPCSSWCCSLGTCSQSPSSSCPSLRQDNKVRERKADVMPFFGFA